MKAMERQARQRLNAFVLRHGKIYESGKSKWTQAHFRWLERVKFEIPVRQIVFEEYVDAVNQAQARVLDLEEEMRKAWRIGSLRRWWRR